MIVQRRPAIVVRGADKGSQNSARKSRFRLQEDENPRARGRGVGAVLATHVERGSAVATAGHQLSCRCAQGRPQITFLAAGITQTAGPARRGSTGKSPRWWLA